MSRGSHCCFTGERFGAGWIYLVGSLAVVRRVVWHSPVGLINIGS